MGKKTALTYDDIQLIPRLSDIDSRLDIRLNTQVTKHYGLNIPIVSSCMDTVTGDQMAIMMMGMGGVGCIHRFNTIEEQTDMVFNVFTHQQETKSEMPIMAAIGVNGDNIERAVSLVNSGCQILVIDVAHGHHKNMKKTITTLKGILPNSVDIIGGNIATPEAAKDLCEWGADGLRVGIGGGSLCTTRIKTGFGVPNITTISECVAIADEYGVPVMADGGIRNSGDIAKAIAVGADTVMLGSLLAGTKESPGDMIEDTSGLFKRYRGSASLETKTTHNQARRNVEGVSTIIPFKGGVGFIVNGLLDGLRSAFSLGGSPDIITFQTNVDYNIVTNAGVSEANPHLINK